MWSNEEDGE
jgi:hypothetical protein